MAKVGKVKKREISQHSRAAKRGPSPETAVAVKAPAEETDYKPWLHSTTNAGISKRKKTKVLTRQQKVRQQRDMAKAGAIGDKLEKKVADSKRRSKVVDARRADWSELNDKLAGREGRKRIEDSKKAKKDGAEMEDVEVEPPISTKEGEVTTSVDGPRGAPQSQLPTEITAGKQTESTVVQPDDLDNVT